MIHPNPQQIAATPRPAISPTSATPVSGSWAWIREGSPWLWAFPMAWVPVTDLMPTKCKDSATGSVWDLDVKRCTETHLADTAAMLERRGMGRAQILLAGFREGRSIQIGAGHLAFVEDFTGKKRCAWHEFTASPKAHSTSSGSAAAEKGKS